MPHCVSSCSQSFTHSSVPQHALFRKVAVHSSIHSVLLLLLLQWTWTLDSWHPLVVLLHVTKKIVTMESTSWLQDAQEESAEKTDATDLKFDGGESESTDSNLLTITKLRNEKIEPEKCPPEVTTDHDPSMDSVENNIIAKNGVDIYKQETKMQSNVFVQVSEVIIHRHHSGLTDSEMPCLKDVVLGFDDEDNLKEPLTGFTNSYEEKIFPIVDEQSMMLHEIVENLENEQMSADVASILSYKKPILVPRRKYSLPGGGGIALRIFNTVTGTQNDWKRGYTTMDPDLRHEVCCPTEKLALLLKPLNTGWRREIVLRSEYAIRSKTCDIVYHTPDNIKLRTSKQVDQYLADNPCGLTLDNFWFRKGRVCNDPSKETIRTACGFGYKALKQKPRTKGFLKKMSTSCGSVVSKVQSCSRRLIQPPKRYLSSENLIYPDKIFKMKSKKSERNESEMQMGMLPPKYPKGREDTSTSSKPLSLSPDSYKARRRGRPPKPGGKTERAQAAAATASILKGSHPDDSMFQISAFRQSQLMASPMEEYHEMQDMKVDSYSGSSANETVDAEEGNSWDKKRQNSAELLPCSVRCSAASGQVPTLQCKRCLCLYHPECLDPTSNNLTCKDFICSNCEGKSSDEKMDGSLPPQDLSINSDVKMSPQSARGTKNTKLRPPPPLLPGSFFPMPNLLNSKITEFSPSPPRKLPLPKLLPLRPLSSPLGASKLLSSPLGASRPLSSPLGTSRPLSSPLGTSRPLTSSLGTSRPLSSAVGPLRAFPPFRWTPLLPLRPLTPLTPLFKGGFKILPKSETLRREQPRNFQFSPINSGCVSHKLGMSITTTPMKRPRDRHPRNNDLISRLSTNLTITPITLPKKTSLPPTKPAAVFPKGQDNTGKLVLVKFNKRNINTGTKSTPPTTPTSPSVSTSSARLKEVETPPQVLPTDFRKYIQGVVTIGQEKVVFIRNKSTSHSNDSLTPASIFGDSNQEKTPSLNPTSVESTEAPENSLLQSETKDEDSIAPATAMANIL